MSDCIFCKIIDGEIPGTKVYEDEYTYAFLDIAPVAKTHIVLVPKKHVKDVLEAIDEDLMKHINDAIYAIVKQEQLYDDGFRIVMNTGANAGQSVFHMHAHILAGGELSPKFGK